MPTDHPVFVGSDVSALGQSTTVHGPPLSSSVSFLQLLIFLKGMIMILLVPVYLPWYIILSLIRCHKIIL